jgi:hippurate hydrolase
MAGVFGNVLPSGASEWIRRVSYLTSELVAWRRDFHQHPELGFAEYRTADLIARRLASWGIEVRGGIGGTGVVGVLRGRGAPRPRVGLRADMDALPIQETTKVPYRSLTPGVMHACGHDGHITMLLGAARFLADHRDFTGTAIFIFQPAEEMGKGAEAMIADGLFDRFPCDEIYGLHFWPGLGAGTIAVSPDYVTSAADQFELRVTGRSAHLAFPHEGVDALVAAAAIVQELQTIVSRNADPTAVLIITLTELRAGGPVLRIPGSARMTGQIRSARGDVRRMAIERLSEVATGVAGAHGAGAEMQITQSLDAVRNSPEEARRATEAAEDVAGNVVTCFPPTGATEDFAVLLRQVPGAFVLLGGGSGALHTSTCNFDDSLLPVGVAFFARIVTGDEW